MTKKQQPTKPLVIHLYRGAPEVHSWSHYQKRDCHWSLCGHHRTGKTGFLPLEGPHPSSGHVATTILANVNCVFCCDLIEGTQKRQANLQAGVVSAITDEPLPVGSSKAA